MEGWAATLEAAVARLAVEAPLAEVRRVGLRTRHALEAIESLARQRAAVVLTRAARRWFSSSSREELIKKNSKAPAARRKRALRASNNRRSKKPPPKMMTRAAAARVALAERRVAAAEERAAKLRSELCGNGWCNAANPSWQDHDRRIQRRLEKGAKKESKEEEEPNSSASGSKPKLREDCAPLGRVLDAIEESLAEAARREASVCEVAVAELEAVGAWVRSQQTQKSEDRPPTLDEARDMLRAAVERLLSGDASAEVEVERLDQLVRSHPDYAREVAEHRRRWDDEQAAANRDALRRVRSAVPPDIFSGRWTLDRLVDEAGLPRPLAKRVISTRSLWLTRLPADRVLKIHVADLRTSYDASTLDLLELRALYAVLPVAFDNDPDKAAWRDAVRDKLADVLRADKTRKKHSCWSSDDDDGTTFFDPDDLAWTPDEAHHSGLDTAASDRARELEELRAHRRQATPSKRRLVVDLRRKPKTPVATKHKATLPLHNLPAGGGGGGGGRPLATLMDQLKAKLRDRQFSS